MSQSFPPPGDQLPEPGPVAPEPGPERAKRSPVAIGVLVGVLIFALVAAGFAGWRIVDGDDEPAATDTPTQSATPSPSPTPTAEQPATDPRLARFYSQTIDWKKCDRDECGTLEVPLDYAAPDGETVTLSLLKVPAQDRNDRIGSLVVNPGGPGGSGVDYAARGSVAFGTALADRYDIVGFDPRGVGRSDPLKCLPTSGLDRLLAFDPDPDDQAERDQMDRLVQGFGQGCLDESGALAEHISTPEAARDMDILRAALGEAKLDYFGASYGTFLGATYADLFPTHVGRFVLDGAIDPSLSNEQLTLQQAGGFETALRAYVADCVSGGGCILGDSVDQGTKRIRKLLDDTDAKPLRTDDADRPLTEGLALIGVILPLYVREAWPQLTTALEQAIDDGDGTSLLRFADLYASRGPDGYSDNSMEALYAVNCLDHNDYIETRQVPSHFAQFEKVSPTFGRFFAFSLSTCANWPVKTGNRTVALHAKGAPPIVVIGTTRDPATPMSWARGLAKQLESGRLITRDGDGHTGFQSGNDCVDDAVEAWLINGKVPAADLRC